MHDPASAHDIAGTLGTRRLPVVRVVCTRRSIMTQSDPRHDPEVSTDARYAGFDTEDGYVLYDTENPAAWIESDTTHSLRE